MSTNDDDPANNNNDRVDFDVSNDGITAGFISRIYRIGQVLYFDVRYDPEKPLIKIWVNVAADKINNLTKNMRIKTKETLTPIGVDNATIALIVASINGEIAFNLHKLNDLASVSNAKKKEHKSGEDIWSSRRDIRDLNQLNHNDVLRLRHNRNYSSFANKITKTKIPLDDPMYIQLQNTQNLAEDERFRLYQEFENLRFIQHNRILYEAYKNKHSKLFWTLQNHKRKNEDERRRRRRRRRGIIH